MVAVQTLVGKTGGALLLAPGSHIERVALPAATAQPETLSQRQQLAKCHAFPGEEHLYGPMVLAFLFHYYDISPVDYAGLDLPQAGRAYAPGEAK